MKFTCFKGLNLRRKSEERNLLLNNQQLISGSSEKLSKKAAIKSRKSETVAKDNINLDQFIDINAKTSSWYLPEISSEKCADILEALPVGRFVIRKSGNKLHLHLKHAVDAEPSVYLISPKQNGICFDTKNKHFSNLSSLVVHHSIMPESLPVNLRIAEIHDARDSDSDQIDFIDIDVDPEFSDLVMRLKSNMTFV
jgi:hypothetical protein